MSVNFIKSNSVAMKPLEIENALLARLKEVVKAMLPAGKNNGADYRVGDVHGKAGESLSICLSGEKKGLWKDHATDEGGNIISLIAAHFDLNAKTELKAVLAKAEEILSSLDKAPAPIDTKHPALKKVAEWDYLNADGTYLWSIVRYEDPSGKKTIRPHNKVTGEYKAHPEPRPLFNLPGISTSEVVILVEGEKCAQALIDAGYCATTAMLGAQAPASKTDWSPLSGKNILIWPDNDDVGMTYAINCAEAALSAGAKKCEVLAIPEGMPGGWDVADALAESVPLDIDSFLKECERVPIEQLSTPALFEAFKKGDWRTEHSIAATLSKLFGADWKYCAAWGQWFRWNDRRWIVDQILAFHYLVRQVCHTASTCADVKDQGVRARIASAATISNVERMTRADPIHATPIENWDADPMLLNTTGGIVDLNTGELVPHNRDKFLTKSATATPQGCCPHWLEFLADITGGNLELIDYLQRVVGYCLTGLTTEHALFFLYGTGANGKSVFLNVISSILGDYAKTAPMDTFMDTRSDRHPTDLAGLRGARFVCAIETEQGRRWNESKIKAITGGDSISARFMRQDFFEFKPQFKLLIAGNHKPSISNVDEAMSRRIHLIPFTVFIPPEKRDKHLTAKLINESDGILAWAIQGLVKWKEIDGLKPPEIVTKATQEYLDAEDTVGRWLEDCCEIEGSAFSSTKKLFESWKYWADEFGEYVGSSRKLSDQLITRKFERAIQKGDRGFKGISIGIPDNNWKPNLTVQELEALL